MTATGGGGGGGVTPSSTEPSKQDVVAALLTRGAVLVTCDARACDVPAHLAAHPQLNLRFGWVGMKPPIPDMKLDRWSISGTMTFGGVTHHCVVPWKHVFAAQVDGERSVVSWPHDVPTRGEPGRAALEEALAELAPKRRGGHLKLVE